MNEIADKIKNARIQRKITPSQLAARAGITYKTVWKYESGGSVPNINIAIGLAKALNMSLDELFLPENVTN